MTVKMTARRRLPYAGRVFKPGDSFEASSKDALVLEAIGSAERVVETTEEAVPESAKPEQPGRRNYHPRDLKAEDTAHEDGPPRRRYRRRDMQAEDGA